MAKEYFNQRKKKLSQSFFEIDQKITLFVNRRKTIFLYDRNINTYDEILTTVNKLIYSWRV